LGTNFLFRIFLFRLLRGDVDASSLEMFKARLDGLWSGWAGGNCTHSRALEQDVW